MEAGPWKVRVRERAAWARGCCNNARVLLAQAAELLVGNQDARGVAYRLKVASMYLAVAAADMAACEILALRGGAAAPWFLLPSVHHLPDAHRSVRLALGVLQSARACAEDACDSVERCCARVSTAYLLVHHPGVPGADGVVAAELAAARGFLEAAQGLATSSVDLADAAIPLVI